MTQKQCYIFNVAGGYSGGLSVRRVLEARIEAGSWPLNKGTAHQSRLKRGDPVLFYGTGRDPDGQRFLAQARIAGPVAEIGRRSDYSEAWLGKAYAVSAQVPIEGPEWFPEPVEMRPLLSDLEFIKNEELWGVHMMGGVRQIPPHDFQLILEYASQSEG